MNHVAVIGTGMVGCSWALVFARGGFDVTLYDKDEDAIEVAIGRLTRMAEELSDAGLLADQKPNAILSRLTTTSQLETAVGEAGYVQECVPEVLVIKQEVFSELERLASPSAVLASSTSSLIPSSFTEHLKSRERCLVAHPINPPHLHDVVEIVPSEWTSPDTIDLAKVRLIKSYMKPLVLKRELEGFLVNRLQGAMLQEAFRLMASGVASASDIDQAVSGALAPRWGFAGPFETIDLNAPRGIVDYVERYGQIYADLAADHGDLADWPEVLKQGLLAERERLLPRDQLEDRRQWRDKRLMAYAVAKRKADESLGV
jgi:L-gulonate 3-dehydrogenase